MNKKTEFYHTIHYNARNITKIKITMLLKRPIFMDSHTLLWEISVRFFNLVIWRIR